MWLYTLCNSTVKHQQHLQIPRFFSCTMYVLLNTEENSTVTLSGCQILVQPKLRKCWDAFKFELNEAKTFKSHENSNQQVHFTLLSTK